MRLKLLLNNYNNNGDWVSKHWLFLNELIMNGNKNNI